MKNVILIIVFIFSASFLYAQDAETKEKETRLESLKKELSLTDEQAAKVKEAFQKRANAHKDAKDKSRKAKKASLEAFDADMKTILTPDQLVKYEEHKEEKGTPASKAERLAHRFEKELVLSEEQATAVEAAALDRFTKADALKDASDKKAERDVIMTDFDAKMKTILRPEQYTKYEKNKEKHKGHGNGHGKGHGKGKKDK